LTEHLQKNTREARYNCDAQAGALASALRKNGVRIARPLQTCCRNTRRALQRHFLTMAYMLQKSSKPAAKAHCRRSGLPGKNHQRIKNE
jgi:hypothetical protein